ncbi:alkaline phosphatase D family protein [Flavobacterium difficile]|uniref:Alkaline phosphatase family protein n=1 Tax=Flavobacterium difficile TaxID=2709659 RepID=A0ABX0I7B9_9FLAO|nr:alkaline phosphatase D family protein [Flavobacterium difficile]NHM03036.1 alkaline phosphatase family protein [Flavobacterium difficile]
MRFILAFLLFSVSIFSQNNLQSGPMVGYCEMKEAMIWLQTEKPASVFIEYYATENAKQVFQTSVATTNKENGFTCHLLLDKLQPGKKYNYSVFIDKKKIELPYETSFSSKKLWQWRENAPDFTIALGSCSYVSEESLDRPGKPYGSNYFIFESIAKKNPDIMLWGGDNIYLREADWDSQTGIYHRYSHSRKIKEMQPLLAKTQNFAIWDDHDFGPNDSDRGFYNKYVTQQAFKDFWANKFYGTNPNQKEGVYSSFNWGDAEVFLLDNRFFKSPNERVTGNKELLGATQMQWLIDALVASKASFKLIVVGGQVLNSAAVFENYENYKAEKELLLNEIAANKIKGVLFISGDRHFSELSELKRANTYSLFDWTVSPLTSGHGNLEKVAKEDNQNRVAGSLFAQHVFGTVSFSGDKENRQMKLTLFDNEGKELWNKVILKKDLE